MIYEESFRSQLKDFAIGNTSKTFFKNGIYWRFYGFIMQKIYNLGRWDDKLELLKKSTKS